MTNEKVFAMSFAKVYPMLIAKAERKGRTRDEVQKVTAWLTGYSREQLEELMVSDITYGDFFRNAPALNPARKQIKGSICGVKVETIEDPLMREIRYLDKLVDELASVILCSQCAQHCPRLICFHVWIITPHKTRINNFTH